MGVGTAVSYRKIVAAGVSIRTFVFVDKVHGPGATGLLANPPFQPRYQTRKVHGIPPNPCGWITATARNRAIDRVAA